jgi:hypothetical protein
MTELTELNYVKCPNMCHSGMTKILMYDRALYDMVKCPYCKGKGIVSKEEAKKIDALL